MSAELFSTIFGSAAAAVLYGGGQIPSANFVIGTLVEQILRTWNITVYGIRKSFMGLVDETCYEHFSFEKANILKKQLGTYLEMCRNVDPSKDEWFYAILNNLKKYNIQYLFIPGGDGSLRASTDLIKRCMAENYYIRVIFIPCTIDGITGSLSIGINSAVAESIRRTQAMIVNSFATWDYNFIGPRIAIIELQGRNRNDILLHVMKWLINQNLVGRYLLQDINIVCLPAGYKWSYLKVINSIKSSDKPTLVIVAEGAEPNESKIWTRIVGNSVGQKIANLINFEEYNNGQVQRKANLDIIGYLSQTNDYLSDEEKNSIFMWTLIAAQTLGLSGEDSKAITKQPNGCVSWTPLEDLAKLNPNSKEAVPISKEEMELLKPYLL